MNLLLFVVLPLLASAAPQESGTLKIQTEMSYAVLNLEARCRPPRFEDDAFTVYYTKASYARIARYLDQGYSAKLLDATCGGVNSPTEIPADRDVAVRVLVYDYSIAKADFDAQVRRLVERY